jgi:DNA mismatch repair protein MutS2
MPVVELNNRWHELQLDERDEVRRILAELSALIGENSKHIHDMVKGIAELDLALMKAKYAEDMDAAEPLLEPYREGLPDHPGCTIRLYQARHPLIHPENVVPLDVVLDDQTYSLVITGPNTGGKTVTLKTVGLLTLMAQSGLHIPTLSGSTLSIFKDVYADIGDEQSIEQSLSTFSGHITNIIHILKQADETTLVLLDELGAGTDPQDGAALAQGILSNLMFWRIPNLVATHFPALKYFAHLTPGTLNASMEFNLETLQPTYSLMIGLPGKSNALLIAERLGLPVEIIQKARSTQNPDELRSDDLLEEILRQREFAKVERQEAEDVRQEAEETRLKLIARLEKIEDERTIILQQARTEAVEEIEELQSELISVRRTLKKKGQQVDELKVLQRQMEDLQKSYQEPVRRCKLKGKTPSQHLKVGDRVRLQSLGMDGEISSVGDKEAEVQAGALRVRAKISDIQLISKSGKPKSDPGGRRPRVLHKGSVSIIHPSPGMELDLRGQRAEDALDNLTSYLEDAYLAGLPLVRIIHGKGTGRLRSAVREALGQSRRIKSWEKGLDGEGGEGVTVAHISVGG